MQGMSANTRTVRTSSLVVEFIIKIWIWKQNPYIHLNLTGLFLLLCLQSMFHVTLEQSIKNFSLGGDNFIQLKSCLWLTTYLMHLQLSVKKCRKWAFEYHYQIRWLRVEKVCKYDDDGCVAVGGEEGGGGTMWGGAACKPGRGRLAGGRLMMVLMSWVSSSPDWLPCVVGRRWHRRWEGVWEGVCWQAGAGSGLGWGGRETDVHLATPACPARLSRYRPRHTAAEFLTVTTCDRHSPPTKYKPTSSHH